MYTQVIEFPIFSGKPHPVLTDIPLLNKNLTLSLRTSLSLIQIAIEPIPYKYNWLKQKFPNVEILSMAVSDTEGEANFYMPRRSSFSGLGLRSYTQETEQNIEFL